MLRTLILTALALTAFAANSLLARAGLSPIGAGGGPGLRTGPLEFTLIRLVSGAIMLAFLLRVQGRKPAAASGSWAGAVMLLIYALFFSLAYVSLETGLGALYLFTAVQLTILGAAAVKKDLSALQAAGAAIAFAGFIYLIFPNLTGGLFKSQTTAIFMMLVSGIGWGVYTILGRSAKNPLALTGLNFRRAAILSLPLLLVVIASPNLSARGAALAIFSGSLTSGAGYAIWYAVLPRLTSAFAGAGQLLVPPLAAFMGWAFLGEAVSERLVIATLIIIGGLGIVLMKRRA